jgi:hypothetical protein
MWYRRHAMAVLERAMRSFVCSVTCAAALALVCAACGGSQSNAIVPGAFTPEHALLFDDGVDLIEDPEALQGRWKADFDRELDQRAEEADVVVSGVVSTVRVEQDPELRSTYHLLFRVDSALKGEPQKSELQLSAREGARGYGSVVQHRDRILERPLVAFVRYAAGENGALIPHFHLSAPSPTVTTALQRREAADNPHRVKVIEHTQKD